MVTALELPGRGGGVRAGARGGGLAANEPMHARSSPPMEWMTAAEGAEYLRLPTTKALYQRVARGQIKAYRLGPSSSMRFRRRDLDALMRPMAALN